MKTLIMIGNYYLDKIPKYNNESEFFYRISFAEKARRSFDNIEEALKEFGKLVNKSISKSA